jgi:hypothetical protein
VAHNTADVRANLPFYLEGLGLDFLYGVQTPEVVPNVYSPGGGVTSHDGAAMCVRGDDRVLFDYLQWDTSADHAVPYAQPNHVGIIRCAIEVDDLDAAYLVLRQLPWAIAGAITIGAPEVWDFGAVFGARRVVNFTDPEGIGFQLVEQPPQSQLATLDPFHLGGPARP